MRKITSKYMSLFVILLVTTNVHLFAQCDNISTNYPAYFFKRSLALDSIEGKWFVTRSVKILKNNRPINIVKELNYQTWFVLRQEDHFVVCNEKMSSQQAVAYFSKSANNSASYIFNMFYLDDNQSVKSSTVFVSKKLYFSYFETVKRVKQLFKDKFSDDISIEYDYEMEKDRGYKTTIVEQVPKVKNFIIQGVKNYFNL